ncbi:hypothetical protein [Paracerasibacillus soli]|uniref:Yip1 domain-containing protein n=1 Tax=Paracerasibacillus soli TaxID=480284 RepID=A0ABU5CVI9_9BACI|nr:hypothetical protein [Virgibacillus soli]MDY0410341.1 hypothetical protein [Virgibacillus soli]
MKYLKLVNFEINRFFKLYMVLVGMVIVSQIAGVIVESRSFIKEANMTIRELGLTYTSYAEDYGSLSLGSIMRSGWFVLPIALCIAGLSFYVFFIWYRDWFGKNTFVYRLLMLPTARLNIYFAKATTIFISVLGLVGLQLLLLPIENKLFRSLVPVDLRHDAPMSELFTFFDGLGIIIPAHLSTFIIHYGIGFMIVFIIFTAILFERSYRLKGIVFGGLYCVIALGIFLLPFIIVIYQEKMYLYPNEMFG